MKLPRWLSPVRTVEAETGWPRALCQQFVGRRASALMLTIWIGWIATMSAIVAARLLFGEDVEQNLVRDILFALAMSLLFGSVCLLLAARSLAEVARSLSKQFWLLAKAARSLAGVARNPSKTARSLAEAARGRAEAAQPPPPPPPPPRTPSRDRTMLPVGHAHADAEPGYPCPCWWR